MKKFVVLDVQSMNSRELEEKLNELYQLGYKLTFHSNIEWYQDEGMWGLITFELQEEVSKQIELKDKTLREIKSLIPLMQEELESPSLRHNTGNMILSKIEEAL